MKDADRYLKIVEWSEEDGCYVGSCPELFMGGCHGADQARVYEELCQIVEDVVADMKEDGDPLPPGFADREFSGKFLLRPGKDLHKALAIRAMKAGKSLQSYCVDMLKAGR